MNDLTAFLNARYDRLEELARAADGVEWTYNPPLGDDGTVDHERGFVMAGHETHVGVFIFDELAHMAAVDPAYVLADIDSKRRILAEIATWRHYACSDDSWYSCAQATVDNGYSEDLECADENRHGEPCDCGLDRRRGVILGALAAPYAGHPDFQKAWLP